MPNSSSGDSVCDWYSNNKILFVVSAEIYVMNSDGSNESNLTNNPASDYNAKWSPDGSKIVFERIQGNDEKFQIDECQRF